VINAKKVTKHFIVDITDEGLSWRQQAFELLAVTHRLGYP
jgi:hypothetical protein